MSAGEYLIAIFLGMAAVYGLYMLSNALASGFGRKELKRSDISSEENGAINIYANAESLEYYIRCALMSASLEKIQIVVNIRRNDISRDEMIDITERLGRTHKNLTYRLI